MSRVTCVGARRNSSPDRVLQLPGLVHMMASGDRHGSYGRLSHAIICTQCWRDVRGSRGERWLTGATGRPFECGSDGMSAEWDCRQIESVWANTKNGLGNLAACGFRCGKIVTNFAASISLVTAMLPIPHQSAAIQEATGCFLQFLECYLIPGSGRLRCSRRRVFCMLLPTWWTHYLNRAAAASPMQSPFHCYF